MHTQFWSFLLNSSQKDPSDKVISKSLWGGEGRRGKHEGGHVFLLVATKTWSGPGSCALEIAQMKYLVTCGKSEESGLLEAGFLAPRWRIIRPVSS